jgi:formyl-CoA transferase
VAVREMLQRVPLPDGQSAELVGPVAKFSRTPTRLRSGAPRAGQHTHEMT